MAYPVATKKTTSVTATTVTISLPSHTTNDLLFVVMTNDGGTNMICLGTTTATITNASPGVFTYSGSDIFTNGDQIQLTTSGALPTGLAVDTRYYVKNLNTGANTFEVSATSGGASINTSSAGSGTHTVYLMCAAGGTYSGWNCVGIQAAKEGIRTACAWKLAASSSETSPVFTGTNANWVASTITVRDADTTTPIGLTSGTDFVRADWGNSTNIKTGTPGSLTTGTAGCLLMYIGSSDGGGNQCRFLLNDVNGLDRYGGSAYSCGHVVGFIQQESAGAAPTPTMYHMGSTEGGNIWTIAIRNKSGGVKAPALRAAVNEINWYGDFGNNHTAVTWQSPDNFAATINSISTTTTAPSTSNSNPITLTPWGTSTELRSTDSTAGLWVGNTHTITSTDMTGLVFGIQWVLNTSQSYTRAGDEGILVCFSDGTNWVAYQIWKPARPYAVASTESAFIALGVATAYASSGSINWGAVTRVAYLWHRIGSNATQDNLQIKNAVLMGTTKITGGGVARPATWSNVETYLKAYDHYKLAELQGTAQVLAKCSLQVGDGGSNTTYFDASAASIEYPPAWSSTDIPNWNMAWNALANAVTVGIYAGASDTINLTAGIAATASNQTLTVHASSSTSATYSFAGTSIIGFDPTWKTGVTCNSATFKQNGAIDFKGADITSIIARDGLDQALILASDGFSATDCTFTASTTAIYGIRIAAAGTFDLSGTTFSGFTKDIDVTAAVGTVTINLAQGQATPTYQTAGATVTIVAYEDTITFTGLVAGTQVKIFLTGTTTIVDEDASSGTSFETIGLTLPLTVDYTIMKAGYLPIRVEGAVWSASLTIPVTQSIDRAYVASSGLTFTTNATANTSTKIFSINAATTGQNWYSFMIEAWIAQSSLENIAFPLTVNGPNSVTAGNGWEWRGWASSQTQGTGISNTSLALLSRDGMRYVSAAGVVNAIWAAILTLDTEAGLQVKYRQATAGTITSAANTGPMDQLVQIFGTASYGNFDYRDHMVLKVQKVGYSSPKPDLVATYGNLEDQFYVVGLDPELQYATTNSDPGSIAFDNTAKTAILSASRSILQLYQGAQWWSIQDAQWDADIPLTANTSGTTFTLYTGWTLSGMNYITGTQTIAGGTITLAGPATYTPTFSANTAVVAQGEGTYVLNASSTNITFAPTANGVTYVMGDCVFSGTINFHNTHATRAITIEVPSGTSSTTSTAGGTVTITAPQVYQSVTVTGLTAGSRIQIYDTTSSTELYNDVVAGTSHTWTDSVAAAATRAIRLRVAYVSGATAKEFIDSNIGTCATSGAGKDVSYLASQVADDTYNTNAIDGSTVTDITIAIVGGDRVKIAKAGGTITWASIYAYQVYWQSTATGIAQETAFIEAPDTANYLLADFDIKNTHATVPLTITGGWGRDSVTGLSKDIIDTTGSNIYMAPDHVIPYSTGSGLTAGQAAELTAAAAAPSAAANAAATWGEVIEAGLTAEEVLRIIAAPLAGKVSGAGTGTETFTGLDGSTARVVSSNDSSGNRTAVVVDGA